MIYMVSTASLEEILKNPETIPSPLIIQRHTQKSVMFSIIPHAVHYLYMGYDAPVYLYIIKDNWFKKHLPSLNITYDTGVLKELPSLMNDYEANKVRIQEIYPKEKMIALPQNILYDMLQDFGATHSFKNADYYGCVLRDCKIYSE